MSYLAFRWIIVLSVATLAATSVGQEAPTRKATPHKPAPAADLPRAAWRGALPATLGPSLYEKDFSDIAYGAAPAGWRDLGWSRPSRNWAVDGNGFLRLMVKRQTGTIAYGGALSTGESGSDELQDVITSADFKKTEDEEVAFGIVGRLRDSENYYHARLVGTHRFELLKVKDGTTALLGSLISLEPYEERRIWRMTLALRGELMTAVLADEKGRELARIDGRDDEFKAGRVGLRCTTYAAAKSFQVHTVDPATQTVLTPQQVAEHNAATVPPEEKYVVVRPHQKIGELHTRFDDIAGEYDIIVAGAGTGGTAAAVQAARNGMRVLLLEPTDWIGGQMSCAAVASMDDASCWEQYPVRERGIYREFHESMVTYYYGLDKDPYNAYYSGKTLDDQVEGGYEPKVTRAVLYGLIADARSRASGDDRNGTLDTSLFSTVTKVHKNGATVTGVTVRVTDNRGVHEKDVRCTVVIDATEYGDVIPLTGARYRVGNVTSENLDLNGAVQDHTWTGVFREYPQGIPDHLRLRSTPPGYEKYSLAWRHYDRWGPYETVKGRRNYRVYFAWRGMADTEGPMTGVRTEHRHTQCGFNGGNDYPVSVATIENLDQRKRDEREGIYRTLAAIYFFQNEMGLKWSLAEDEGYDTPYNRHYMKSLQLTPEMEALAVHLPQQPYVRESRRIIGVNTLVAADLERYEREKLMPTSVAMGDYFMDLHRTGDAIETDLDTKDYTISDGPFQVPFESFIPEKIDGFLPAEKNLSQSRIVSGATRLQPITMLTGQAVGTIASMAVRQGVQPRQLDPKQVQWAQLELGSTLVQRWYRDVPWNTPIWRATQLLSLYQVMDRPGPINKDKKPLGSKHAWGVDRPLDAKELVAAVSRLTELKGASRTDVDTVHGTVSASHLREVLSASNAKWAQFIDGVEWADPQKITAGEFALVAARILLA